MISRTIISTLLHAAVALGVCTKLEDCKQYQHLKTSSCQTYHHIIARGSNSPYPGHVIETVGKVCNALNTHERPNACGYEDVQYRAETGGDKWCASSHEGAVNAAAQMKKYSASCPGSHLILMGFSQGGSVLLDALGGGGGELWGCMQADNPAMNISTSPGSKVAAALVFGPTRRSANQSWTQGGGQAYNGASPRTPAQLMGLQPYAATGNLREYCQPGDPICAHGSSNTSMSKHLNYFDIYSDEAAAWVLERIQNAPALPDIPSSASLHPVANVFILLFVLLALYFLIRKVISWRASRARLASYAPVNTSESV